MKNTEYIYFISLILGIIGLILFLFGINRVRKLQKEHNYEISNEILSEKEKTYQNITVKILFYGSFLMIISMIISGILGVCF